MLAGAVPQGHDVGFTPGEVAGMGVARLPGVAIVRELLVGELTDRLEHRKPRLARCLLSDDQRFAHQCIEQIDDSIAIHFRTRYRAGTFEVEATREAEHRSSSCLSASSRRS